MPSENQNNYTISKTLFAVNVVIVVSIVLMIFVIYGSPNQLPKDVWTKPKESQPSSFEQVRLEAKSAYVFDVSGNKVLFSKGEFIQLPLASITKLMTVLLASEMLPEDYHVTIKKEFMGEDGGSGLFGGEIWKLKNLIDFSLVVSSNGGARAIASVAGAFDLKNQNYTLGRKNFIAKMNLRAQDLGLKQTYYINESGLDEGNSSGGYGSAIDVEKLMEYIVVNKPKLLEATKYPMLDISSFDKVHKAKNTNTETNTMPGLLASKTGYTDLAGGNLVVAFDSSVGKVIIVVVLGSTEQGRFSDVASLVKASLDYMQVNNKK